MGFNGSTKLDTDHATTRRHLLEAAGGVFEEVGFRAATVRQICQRAGANIAAVNYHFGDKEKLYHAVLQETCRFSQAAFPADYGMTPDDSPEERLRAFVFSFLKRIFSEGLSARHGKLMVREMIEPTGALDEMVDENIRPMQLALRGIIRDLLGGRAGEKVLTLCSLSVVSQILFYHHCRPVLQRLYPEMKFDATAIEALTEHITQFSLAAIRHIARPAAAPLKPRRKTHV